MPGVISNGVFVAIRARSGVNLAVAQEGKDSWPLIHVQPAGSGSFVYIASTASPALLASVIDGLRGPAPVVTSPPEMHAFVTWQKSARRWILHLIDDGAYSITIRQDYVRASRIAGQFPAKGWGAEVTAMESGLRISVHGGASGRLLILKRP